MKHSPIIMWKSMQRTRSVFGLVCVALLFGAALPTEVLAAPKCGKLHWVKQDAVRINAAHIFCGELKGGKPKGFHSMALADSAGKHLIELPLQNVFKERNGVYNARVNFRGGARKNSTLFPKHCSYPQVLKSIAYAAKHRSGPAKPWGELGASGPTKGNDAYCVGDNGKPFTLRMGLLTRGRNAGSVNTAFPQ